MTGAKIYVRNMVCDRCKSAVENLLKANHLAFRSVVLGEIELESKPSAGTLRQFQFDLQQQGFELIEDKGARQVNEIKKAVVEWVRGSHAVSDSRNFSDFLSRKLNKDYASLSHLFSGLEGTTIEQFVIRQRVERAKELLVYDELSLSQIADQLGYSSVQHLSAQFRKVTGLTPTHFKKIGAWKRISIDKI